MQTQRWRIAVKTDAVESSSRDSSMFKVEAFTVQGADEIKANVSIGWLLHCLGTCEDVARVVRRVGTATATFAAERGTAVDNKEQAPAFSEGFVSSWA